jgi:hypothetical protein
VFTPDQRFQLIQNPFLVQYAGLRPAIVFSKRYDGLASSFECKLIPETVLFGAAVVAVRILA